MFLRIHRAAHDALFENEPYSPPSERASPAPERAPHPYSNSRVHRDARLEQYKIKFPNLAAIIDTVDVCGEDIVSRSVCGGDSNKDYREPHTPSSSSSEPRSSFQSTDADRASGMDPLNAQTHSLAQESHGSQASTPTQVDGAAYPGPRMNGFMGAAAPQAGPSTSFDFFGTSLDTNAFPPSLFGDPSLLYGTDQSHFQPQQSYSQAQPSATAAPTDFDLGFDMRPTNGADQLASLMPANDVGEAWSTLLQDSRLFSFSDSVFAPGDMNVE